MWCLFLLALLSCTLDSGFAHGGNTISFSSVFSQRSLFSSPSSFFPGGGSFNRLLSISRAEQRLDDINNLLSQKNLLQRRLFILPLTTEYVPSRYHTLFEKEQFCDKCSLPQSLGREIDSLSEQLLPRGPCVWEMKRCEQPSGEREGTGGTGGGEAREEEQHQKQRKKMEKVYVSSLDYRAPENYLYVPLWLMQALDLTPYEMVDLKFVQLPPVSTVTLQPLTPSWRRLSQQYPSRDLQEIIENQLNTYTTLTVNTEIPVSVNGEVLEFKVKACQDRRGVSVDGVLIQDQDVETVIDDSCLPRTPNKTE
jgi:hypothetical protein